MILWNDLTLIFSHFPTVGNLKTIFKTIFSLVNCPPDPFQYVPLCESNKKRKKLPEKTKDESTNTTEAKEKDSVKPQERPPHRSSQKE